MKQHGAVSLLLGLFLVASWNVSNTLAQFQLDIEQLAETSVDVEEPVLDEQPRQAGNQLIAVQQNIDAWVFNRHGNASRAKQYLENTLGAKIETLGQLFDLSDDQKNRLRLAGIGDMSTFFSSVSEIRAEYDDQVDQARFQEVWQRVQPLQLRMQRGLFAQDSMLAKVSKRTLNPDQLEQYEQNERERIEFGYRAAIKLAISELEKTTPLLAKQREEIVELLEKAERPKVLGQYINYYVLFRLSQSKAKVEQILKPSQRKSLQQALTQGQAMGEFLKQNGFID